VFIILVQEINYGISNYWNIRPDSNIDEMLQIYGSFGFKTELSRVNTRKIETAEIRILTCSRPATMNICYDINTK
jgi:hypothetical protein